MAGNSLLRRYLGEVVSRCSLILALYGRPHSADCAVNEHREIVAALCDRKAEAAISVMDHHLGSVEHRALLDQGRGGQFDLGAVLSRYAEGLDAGSASRSRVCRGERREPRNDRAPNLIETSFTIRAVPREGPAIRESMHDQISAFAPNLPRRRRRCPVRSVGPWRSSPGRRYHGRHRLCRIPPGLWLEPGPCGRRQGAEGNSRRQSRGRGKCA